MIHFVPSPAAHHHTTYTTYMKSKSCNQKSGIYVANIHIVRTGGEYCGWWVGFVGDAYATAYNFVLCVVLLG